MLRFRGELLDENKYFLSKLQQRGGLISGCVTTAIVAVPITLLTILSDKVFAIAYIVLPLIIFVFSAPLPKNKWDLISPHEIIIYQDRIISQGEKFNYVRRIEDIKLVIDYGNIYLFLFNFPHKSLVFVCQKDLIVDGTIEEFENRFTDLIVRKTR